MRARHALFVFEFLFKLAQVWLLVPAVALILTAALVTSGHLAVSNRDVVDFILKPAGLAYAVALGVLAVASLLFEQASVMVLAALTGPGECPPVRTMLRAAVRKSWRVAQLGAIMAALLALALLPFVLLAVLTYGIFLSGHDVDFYLKVRPLVFWVAAGLEGLLLLAALATATWLYIRWAFAHPPLREPVRPRRPARQPRARARRGRSGGLAPGWLVGRRAAARRGRGGGLSSLCRVRPGQRGGTPGRADPAAAGRAGRAGRHHFVRPGHGAGTAQETALPAAERTAGPPPPGRIGDSSGHGATSLAWKRRLALLSWSLFILAPLALWADLSRYTAARPAVRVTAYRGHARAAPENTLSAIRKAIDSGADYAEVNVQRTADGVIVLVHDCDLKRVAGDPRRVEGLTYDEIRKLDVGSWFDLAFAGERVLTLAEVIKLARGRIKLNIELRFLGPDRRLAREAARLVRDEDFEPDCLVNSFDYDALLEVKRHNPRLRTGLIVAKALGNVGRLEVDALSVRAGALTDAMLRAAHRRGMEVHVWTVNDPGEMVRLIKRGVDNLLTSDPELAIRALDEWVNLTGMERLLLASRLLLGLDP
jgi:glycerophosphoryl diester phosphodiesterase